MADVKWIKITTDIFDDEKILLIESLPDSYAIITVWFKLLCLAGKQNNSGVFMLGQMPYTDSMLATIFRMKEATVTMALKTFEQFGMVEIIDGVITIPNWGKHQNLDQLETKKQYMRNYMQEYREKQKALTTGESSCKTNCKTNSKTNVSSADKDIEEDKEKEKKKNIDYSQIKDLFNDTCVSFPRLTTLSDKRKQAIKARLNTYTVEQFGEMFRKAEASSFLKGKNPRNWQANFDWLIKDSNFAKVLDGNYDDNKGSSGNTDSSTFNTDDFFNDARSRSFNSPRSEIEREAMARMENADKPKTVEDDPELRKRLERLKNSLKGG